MQEGFLMGEKFEVHVWKLSANGKFYWYALVWSGDSLIKALKEMRRLKRAGEKCVKLEWR